MKEAIVELVRSEVWCCPHCENWVCYDYENDTQRCPYCNKTVKLDFTEWKKQYDV